jgi:hypothetical protein
MLFRFQQFFPRNFSPEAAGNSAEHCAHCTFERALDQASRLAKLRDLTGAK